MTKNFIYTASALLISSAFTLTSCQSDEDFGTTPYGEVHLTVTANRDQAGSRTSFEHDGNGGLLTNWDDNDQLVVTDEAGTNLGVLTITSGAGTSSATFEGTVNLGDLEAVNIHYLGNALTEGLNEVKNEVTFDMSAQNGSFASLTDYDYLYSQTVVTNLNNGTATATIDMARAFATGYFTLDCADFSLEAGDVVIISAAEGTTLYSKPVMKLRNSSWTRNVAAEGTVTITKAEAGNDFYVIFPAAQDITPVFTVAKGSTVYTASLGKHSWTAQTHVNADGTSNTPIKVTDWTKDVQPANPGDMGNWGANDEKVDVTGTPFTPTFASRLDAWTLNAGNSYDYIGGWCRCIEYTNGIYNGLLTSKSSSCFYFQWGRYLGFPSNVATGNSYPYNAEAVNLNVGYRQDPPGTVVAYTAAYMGNSSAYNVQRSNDWAICFGQTNNDYLDYIYQNASNGNWYERSVNPCPDGYRLPTYAELSVFIPSTEVVNGSYAEVKVINGKKYAFEWKVGKSNGLYYIDVRSAETTLDKVSVGASIFDDSPTKRIWAYGYLMNNGKQSEWGTTAAYWSSDSGDNNALDNVYGKGGRALYIEFSGSTANFAELNIPFGFGLPVMPVKDSEAKASSIKPWFPYADDMRNLSGYHE